MSDVGKLCRHGSLKRSCNECSLYDEIKELKKALEDEKKITASAREVMRDALKEHGIVDYLYQGFNSLSESENDFVKNEYEKFEDRIITWLENNRS